MYGSAVQFPGYETIKYLVDNDWKIETKTRIKLVFHRKPLHGWALLDAHAFMLAFHWLLFGQSGGKGTRQSAALRVLYIFCVDEC